MHLPPLFRIRGVTLALLAASAPAAMAEGASLPSGVADASAACLAPVLEQLGWRFDLERDDATVLAPGTPCNRATLAEARAAGDLRASAAITRDRDALAALFAHPASHCGYAFLLGDAQRRAVDRLVVNRGLRFSGLQLGWIGFGAGGAERDGWRATRRLARGFEPAQSPSRAIEGLYRGTIRAECGVGRQLAQYAAQYELHGAQDFDRAFAPGEIVIGTFNELQRSGSVLLGDAAGTLERDGRAEAAARRGRQAFAGLPGFIFHVFDATHLDAIHNQAENFVVYEVSAEAAAALREAGGFEPFNARAHELWDLARRLGLDRRISVEGLLTGRFRAWRARLGPERGRLVERMEAILAEPFFRGFRIYVHPQGVHPVGKHFLRLLDLNPRTPFRIELGLHNLHTTMYERWIARRLATCMANGDDAADTAVVRGPFPRHFATRALPPGDFTR